MMDDDRERATGVSEQEWFEVRRFPHGVTMIREPYHDEDVKSYLIEGSRDVAVIDTGLGVGDFAGLVASLSSRRPRLLQSHAHWDHIGASHRFDDVSVHPSEADVLRGGWGAARYVAAFAPELVQRERLPADFDSSRGLPGCEPTGFLEDGDRIDLGARTLEVIHTPGHSPGGVSFLDRAARTLFVGDLLYLGMMYIFLPTSDPAAFRESLRRVAALVPEVDTVYAAHGESPLAPADIIEIDNAFAEVWEGRPADGKGELFGFPYTTYDYGRFSFLMPPEGWRQAAQNRG